MPPQINGSKNQSENPEAGSGLESDPEELDYLNLLQLLKDRCKVWQEKLRLQDWNVTLELRRKHEMADPNSIGCIRIFEEGKDAKIHLLSPVDLVTVEECFIDHEELNYDITLVHELLHLHFHPFAEDDATQKGIAQEQAINILSRSIVSAYQSSVVKPVVPDKPKDHGHYL